MILFITTAVKTSNQTFVWYVCNRWIYRFHIYCLELMSTAKDYIAHNGPSSGLSA
jgi:galactose mutarotase-like enzyme